MKRWAGVGVAIGALIASGLIAPAVHAAEGASLQDRMAGADRYGTSVSISRQWFSQPPALTVYIASGENFPDALAAGAAAGVQKAPVLLSRRDRLTDDVVAELRRLDPSRIVLLGGPGALSAGVEDQARQVTWNVTRIAGTSRYETAAQLSVSAFSPGVPVAYLASGTSFPDALAGAAAAGAQGGPVLLTEPSRLSAAAAAELGRLRPGRIVVLGGDRAVSGAVAAAAGAHGPVHRVQGADRYATAAELSRQVFVGSNAAYVASGENFPDALSGAARAGAEDSPVLLVRPGSVPSSVCAELRRLAPTRVVALGGQAAVSDATLRAAALRCPSPAPAPGAACTATSTSGLDGAVARPAADELLVAIAGADAAIASGYGLPPQLARLDAALGALKSAGAADVCQQAYYTQLLWETEADIEQAIFDSSIFDRSVLSYRSARAHIGMLLAFVNEDLRTSYRLP